MGAWGEAILLAILQGLTEFLPVSSSGHLEALKRLTGSEFQGDLTFDVLLHFGTLLAVLIVYRREIARLAKGALNGGPARRELGLIVLGTLPAGIAGLLLADRIEGLSTSAPYLLPICWAAMGFALLGQRSASVAHRPVTVPAALWIGAWQMVALLPGISRSGITILAALWIGVERETAARYSFFIAAPLIAGATILKFPEMASGATSFGILAVGFVLSFLVGWGALVLLLKMLRGGSLHRFGGYLLAIAVLFSIWQGFFAGP